VSVSFGVITMFKRIIAALATAAVLSLSTAQLAEARRSKSLPDPTLRISISISSQSMAIYSRGERQGSFKVSTGKLGYSTPRGSWRVQRMARVHWSRQFRAPLPHAIFFVGGIAIHATKGIQRLGTRASHGCVRMSPGDAAKVYGLVARHGMKNTLVTVTY
jgi:lipoprotein-anchoring transpeptidase ErfK/SrfK